MIKKLDELGYEVDDQLNVHHKKHVPKHTKEEHDHRGGEVPFGCAYRYRRG